MASIKLINPVDDLVDDFEQSDCQCTSYTTLEELLNACVDLYPKNLIKNGDAKLRNALIARRKSTSFTYQLSISGPQACIGQPQICCKSISMIFKFDEIIVTTPRTPNGYSFSEHQLQEAVNVAASQINF